MVREPTPEKKFDEIDRIAAELTQSYPDVQVVSQRVANFLKKEGFNEQEISEFTEDHVEISTTKEKLTTKIKKLLSGIKRDKESQKTVPSKESQTQKIPEVQADSVDPRTEKGLLVLKDKMRTLQNEALRYGVAAGVDNSEEKFKRGGVGVSNTRLDGYNGFRNAYKKLRTLVLSKGLKNKNWSEEEVAQLRHLLSFVEKDANRIRGDALKKGLEPAKLTWKQFVDKEESARDEKDNESQNKQSTETALSRDNYEKVLRPEVVEVLMINGFTAEDAEEKVKNSLDQIDFTDEVQAGREANRIIENIQTELDQVTKERTLTSTVFERENTERQEEMSDEEKLLRTLLADSHNIAKAKEDRVSIPKTDRKLIAKFSADDPNYQLLKRAEEIRQNFQDLLADLNPAERAEIESSPQFIKIVDLYRELQQKTSQLGDNSGANADSLRAELTSLVHELSDVYKKLRQGVDVNRVTSNQGDMNDDTTKINDGGHTAQPSSTTIPIKELEEMSERWTNRFEFEDLTEDEKVYLGRKAIKQARLERASRNLDEIKKESVALSDLSDESEYQALTTILDESVPKMIEELASSTGNTKSLRRRLKDTFKEARNLVLALQEKKKNREEIANRHHTLFQERISGQQNEQPLKLTASMRTDLGRSSEEGAGREDKKEYTDEEIIEKLLAYQDAPLPDDQLRSTLEDSLQDGSAKKYAPYLRQLIDQYEEGELKALAQEAKAKVADVLTAYGVQMGSFGASDSWVLWDLAKQEYYKDQHFQGKEPANDKYDYTKGGLEKVNEIIDRHIGWEFFVNTNGDAKKAAIEKLPDEAVRQKIQNLLHATPKPDNQLSSWQYAQLGKLLREHVGEIMPRPQQFEDFATQTKQEVEAEKQTVVTEIDAEPGIEEEVKKHRKQMLGVAHKAFLGALEAIKTNDDGVPEAEQEARLNQILQRWNTAVEFARSRYQERETKIAEAKEQKKQFEKKLEDYARLHKAFLSKDTDENRAAMEQAKADLRTLTQSRVVMATELFQMNTAMKGWEFRPENVRGNVTTRAFIQEWRSRKAVELQNEATVNPAKTKLSHRVLGTIGGTVSSIGRGIDKVDFISGNVGKALKYAGGKIGYLERKGWLKDEERNKKWVRRVGLAAVAGLSGAYVGGALYGTGAAGLSLGRALFSTATAAGVGYLGNRIGRGGVRENTRTRNQNAVHMRELAKQKQGLGDNDLSTLELLVLQSDAQLAASERRKENYERVGTIAGGLAGGFGSAWYTSDWLLGLSHHGAGEAVPGGGGSGPTTERPAGGTGTPMSPHTEPPPTGVTEAASPAERIATPEADLDINVEVHKGDTVSELMWEHMKSDDVPEQYQAAVEELRGRGELLGRMYDAIHKLDADPSVLQQDMHIKSGDIDLIYPGEKIDIGEIYERMFPNIQPEQAAGVDHVSIAPEAAPTPAVSAMSEMLEGGKARGEILSYIDSIDSVSHTGYAEILSDHGHINLSLEDAKHAMSEAATRLSTGGTQNQYAEILQHIVEREQIYAALEFNKPDGLYSEGVARALGDVKLERLFAGENNMYEYRSVIEQQLNGLSGFHDNSIHNLSRLLLLIEESSGLDPQLTFKEAVEKLISQDRLKIEIGSSGQSIMWIRGSDGVNMDIALRKANSTL